MNKKTGLIIILSLPFLCTLGGAGYLYTVHRNISQESWPYDEFTETIKASENLESLKDSAIFLIKNDKKKTELISDTLFNFMEMLLILSFVYLVVIYAVLDYLKKTPRQQSNSE